MPKGKSEKEFRRFYERWERSVFGYCRLYLGDRELAESATQEAFLRFFRSEEDLDGAGMPLALLRATVEATQSKCSLRNVVAPPNANRLEEAVPLLACEERAVFILRSVLGETVDEVALAVSLPPKRVNAVWIEALLHLRERLKKR